MRKITSALTILGATALLLLHAVPAQAQATRTWVSGVGDDANPCSRTAPCKTFAGAISKTAVNGIINCLDPGGFGAVTITKSITIDCEEIGEAGVLVPGTNGINIPTDAIVVHLRGLDIEGIGTGLIGVNITGNSLVYIERCKIFGFQSGSAAGVSMTPNTAAALHMWDTRLSDNGTGTTGGGLVVAPTGGGAALAELVRVETGTNTFGVTANASGTTGGINVTIRDSMVAGNSQTGVLATTVAAPAAIMVDRISVVNNGTGISTSGATAIIRVGSSSITGNVTGVSGTGVLSYGNNQLNGNVTDGTMLPVPGGLH